MQIENEYDHVKEAYDEAAGKYIQWAAEMAIGLKTGVPWIMCKSKDAPDTVVNINILFYEYAVYIFIKI